VKPTAFLSHSSRDQSHIQSLKLALDAKTGAAVEFFLSTDGQSIPLGRNWVHRIQQALDDAKLMFVFMSPSAIRSQWVFFEAGYGYARGMRVIPIGVLGFDLAQLQPPLSLLQGFNIKNADGLNNIIAVVNGAFDFKFAETFTASDYHTLFGTPHETAKHYEHDMQEVSVWIPGDPDALLRAAKDYVSHEGQAFTERRDEFATFGMVLHGKRSGNTPGVRGEIDAVILPVSASLLDAMLAASVHADRSPRITITFHDHVKVFPEPHKISARLMGCDVTFSLDGGIEISGVPIKISRTSEREPDGVHVRAVLNLEVKLNFAAIPLLSIVDLLFEKEVLVSAPAVAT
jgi:hypothetical protein